VRLSLERRSINITFGGNLRTPVLGCGGSLRHKCLIRIGSRILDFLWLLKALGWLKTCLHTCWLEHSHVRPALYQDKKRKFGEAKVTKSMI
jgi:hypothetical protein